MSVIRKYLVEVLCVLSLLAFVLIEFFMGREFLSDSGFGMWTGGWTPNTSQWIADPYTFSHVLHGIIFFFALWLFARRVPMRWKFFIALLIEIFWEILENSPIIINRYRAATASLDYFGDSILNSFFDVVFAMVGFWIAMKMPWKWTLAFALLVELILLLIIRDNLTLNVVMLLFPIDAIREWQLAR